MAQWKLMIKLERNTIGVSIKYRLKYEINILIGILRIYIGLTKHANGKLILGKTFK